MATILVVDDELGIRELLSEILSDEGHTIILADNAQAARAYREQSVPDLVLLDIWMPGMDGLTLLREWAVKKMLTMPVIMMSGHATIDTAVEATKIGAIQYLEKPISLQKLLVAVEQALTKVFRQAPPEGFDKGSSLPVVNLPNALAMTMNQHTEELNRIGTNGESNDVQAQKPMGFLISFDLPLREARDLFEKAYLEYHLQHERNIMTRVAQKTGLERTHLYRKLRQLGIEVGKDRGGDADHLCQH